MSRHRRAAASRQVDDSRAWSWPAWFWPASLLLFTFLIGCFPIVDPDFWWHLRTGQLIWERGEIPRTDWFTYTNPDAVWIDMHWGFQLVIAAIWAVAGSTGIVVAKSLVGMTTFACCWKTGRGEWPAWHTTACWLAPVLLFAFRYQERPEMVTLLLFAATLWVLDRARGSSRWVWWLPVIQLIWVNVEGLFVLEFVLVGCFLVDAVLRHAWSGGRDERLPASDWRSLLASVILMGAVSLVNPYGLAGVLFPIQLFGRVRGPDREFYHRLGGELAGLDTLISTHGWGMFFGETGNRMMVLVFVGGVATFLFLAVASARAGKTRVDWFRLLLFAATAYLTWRMRRNATLLAIAGGYAIRANVGELWELARTTGKRLPAVAGQSMAKRGVSREKDAPRAPGDDRREEDATRLPQLFGIVMVLLVLSVPTGFFFWVYGFTPPRWFGFDEYSWSAHDAGRFLTREGMPNHIFAYNTGRAAISIYHAAPQRRVFADPRLEANRRETFEKYLAIVEQLKRADPHVDSAFLAAISPEIPGPYELPSILIDNRSLIANDLDLLPGLLASDRWRCVFVEHNETSPDGLGLLNGAVVFLAREKAEELGLAPADLSQLLAAHAAVAARRRR